MTTLVGSYTPPKRPASLELSAGYVGNINNLSTLGDYAPDFDAWDETTRNSLWKYSEVSLYPRYDRLVSQNPYALMVRNFLQAELFGDGFHPEGPDADAIREFYIEDNTIYKTGIAGGDAITFGTGAQDIMYDRRWRKAPSRTRVIDGSTLRFSLDPNTGERMYAQKTKSGTEVKLDKSLMMTYHMMERPGYAYPMSLYRTNLNFLEALESSGNDVFTVIERIGYAPIIAGLELSDVDSANQASMVTNFQKKMEKTQTAKQNMVIDKRHELTLLGDGGNSAQLLDSNKMMIPIISVCLMNFGMPIGFFLQEGSNRSILDQQRDGIRRFIALRRLQIGLEHERKLYPRITGNTDNKLVWENSFRDNIDLMKNLNQLWISRAISREFYLDQLNYIDTGTTFYDGGGDAQLQTSEGGRENISGEPTSD